MTIERVATNSQTTYMLSQIAKANAKLQQSSDQVASGKISNDYAGIGDKVVLSVQKAEPRKAIKKKDVLQAVVVRQRNVLRRRDGSYIRFDENAVVLIDAKKEPTATRIIGPLPRELKEKGFEKLMTMAEEIV